MRNTLPLFVTLLFFVLLPVNSSAQENPISTDLLVYGATPAGLVAAVAARREGVDVVLIEAGKHLGGMVTSGLVNSDIGNAKVVGGLAGEFFERAGNQYGLTRPAFKIESSVAELVFRNMLKEYKLQVRFEEALAAVDVKAGVIRSITTQGGQVYRAKMYIDASYEGDLMAQAGVPYSVGREGREVYGEKLAGFQTKNRGHTFRTPVSAYDNDGKPLPGVMSAWVDVGTGDSKVPAYNFRPCLTKDPGNKVALREPSSYDPAAYEIHARYIKNFKQITLYDLMYFFALPNQKYDINNRGPVSTNLIGGSWDYPDASPSKRREIWQEHKDYIQGFFWFLLSDERLPKKIRNEMSKWGYCADEFVDTENWPPQLYVREARRMKGSYVLTERDLLSEIQKDDSVGMASMKIESHHVQRLINNKGAVVNEGAVLVDVKPWAIPLRSLLAKKEHVTNLINPVTVSASHVAYSSLRMEPVYMVLGHSAGVVAAMAIQSKSIPHEINYKQLAEKLAAQGQVLSFP